MMLWYFWIYSFFGFLLEKAFAAATHSPHRVRRCFLLLPLCPVYGLGMLAVLAVCIHPFLQLGIQYLLYKLAAFLAAVSAPESLCKLIDGLGGTFGLLLGMTGACALLLLVSILSSVAAVQL